MSDKQNGKSLKRYERQMCLDIYKLQVEMLNKSSDRRVNVNRYYMYAMSFLVLALSAFVVNKGGIFNLGVNPDSTDEISLSFISFALFGICLLGAAITESWIQNASGYLISNSNREKIIRNLEGQFDLPINFHKRMLNISAKKDYIELANHELYAPIIFKYGFLIVVVFGTFYLRDIYGWLLHVVIIALGILLLQSYFIKDQLLELLKRRDNAE